MMTLVKFKEIGEKEQAMCNTMSRNYLIKTSILIFLSLTALSSLAAGDTIYGTISGTCGFKQGSTVVYSETFSGDGTFCTGFMAGGSVSASDTIYVSDIKAYAYHASSGVAPAGYSAFLDFNVTVQVTQYYLFQSPSPPSTPTGFVGLDVAQFGATDDGEGSLCSESATLSSIGGAPQGGDGLIMVPVTFGQPIGITETANITCTQSAPSFDDGGLRYEAASPFEVYDASGDFLENIPQGINVAPEPSTFLLVLLASVPLWALRSRRIGNRHPPKG